jgi:type IV-A pilus assembly ATPase PilB
LIAPSAIFLNIGSSTLLTVTSSDEYMLEVLQESGLINRVQAQAARDATTASDKSTASDYLVAQGIVSHEDISRTIAAASNVEYVDLSQIVVPPDVIQTIDADVARRYKVIPVGRRESMLLVAMEDPTNLSVIDDLGLLLKTEIEPLCTTRDQIQESLVKYYGSMDAPVGGGSFDDIEAAANAEVGEDGGDAPIIKMVSMVLLEAYRARASDIHLEPLEKRYRVRFRIDGVLQEVQNPPKKLQSAITSRIKIMTGSMSIAEKRLPQDGRIQVKIGGKPIDLRVSTVPTSHGESIVMRILDKSSLMLGLPDLGFLSDDQEVFERLITLPDGILLVTGPTGSGKTTTLYSCLHYINKPDRKIITVEDPVEYQMNGINQVQVNADIGMSFPAALRSILRQAPNIIMIGEIRDLETASIAINASLTGHLVFSTLHTNDAPSAIARLVDIGVKPFLVASSIRAAMAQRLVRRLCPKCKTPIDLTDEDAAALRVDPTRTRDASVMKAVGCENCRHKGYRGRMGIFEIFMITDEVRHMINDKMSTVALRQRARELGMRTLREDGVRKVLAGLTTVEEVVQTTMGDLD